MTRPVVSDNKSQLTDAESPGASVETVCVASPTSCTPDSSLSGSFSERSYTGVVDVFVITTVKV